MAGAAAPRQAWTVWREGNVTMPRGNLGPDQAATPYTGRDVRYTSRGDTVYAFLMAWPDGGAARLEALSSVAATVTGVRLLCADGGRRRGAGPGVGWKQTVDALLVDLPSKPPPELCRFVHGLHACDSDSKPRKIRNLT
jgi:alpha-L-fucosidase